MKGGKKTVKKAMVFLMMIVMIVTSSSVSFAADTQLLKGTSSGQSFAQRWQAPILYSSDRHSWLIYGYDTTLIHEDYAYADSIGYIHRSKLVNGKGTFSGPKKAATDGRSDLEITHKLRTDGQAIAYYCMKTSF